MSTTEKRKQLNKELKALLDGIPTKDLWVKADDVGIIQQALKAENIYYKKGVIKRYKNGV